MVSAQESGSRDLSFNLFSAAGGVSRRQFSSSAALVNSQLVGSPRANLGFTPVIFNLNYLLRHLVARPHYPLCHKQRSRAN